MIDFLFVIIEFFRYLLRLKRYKWKFVEVGVHRRGGSLRLNSRLKVTFRANIYGPLDKGMAAYYNFAAEIFHTKKLCIADFIRLKFTFI